MKAGARWPQERVPSQRARKPRAHRALPRVACRWRLVPGTAIGPGALGGGAGTADPRVLGLRWSEGTGDREGGPEGEAQAERPRLHPVCLRQMSSVSFPHQESFYRFSKLNLALCPPEMAVLPAGASALAPLVGGEQWAGQHVAAGAAGTGRGRARSSASRGPPRRHDAGGAAGARPRDLAGRARGTSSCRHHGAPRGFPRASSPGRRRPQSTGSELGALFGPRPGTRRSPGVYDVIALVSAGSRHPSPVRHFCPEK